MKAHKFIIFLSIFLFFVFFTYGNNFDVVNIHYSYEKMVFDNYLVEFNITLPGIRDVTIADLIGNLIFHGLDLDEYVEYRENTFIGDVINANYPEIINDDGTVYLYQSYLNVEYSIEHYDDEYIIIKYFEYFYYTGAAHGLYWFDYLIIDIRNECLLLIEDLINDIPDFILLEIIEEKYDIRYYLRDYIWPSDAVNFSGVGVELLWNIYQITPYNIGLIRIIINESLIEEYLTDKGKELWSITGALR